MNSCALAIVERMFAGRPTFDIVASARTLARGHAAHALALRQLPETRRQIWRRKRAEHLAAFWDAVGLHYGVLDLVEEHAGLPTVLRISLERYASRQGRDVADPPGLDHPSFDPAHLLPPADQLPTALPAAFVTAFGAHLRPACNQGRNKT